MRLLGATASHVGNVREANQDRVFFGGMVAALADGMGGHQGGERAAELAIAEFEIAGQDLSEGELVEVIMAANRQVHGHAADNGLPGMGTTLVALSLHDDATITVANVGDSRAYWLRGDYMGQVTEDHSFVEDLVRQGRLRPEDAADHPQRNILTRAVGIGAEVEVDRFPIPEPMVGDRFLLCSDGLFNELPEEEILEILLEAGAPAPTSSALINAALQTPCRDNVTVAVVDVVDDDHPALQDQDSRLRNTKPITAPVPVVSKSKLHDPVPPSAIPEEAEPAAGQAVAQVGTLVLEGDQRDSTSGSDPELLVDTTELEVIRTNELTELDSPLSVRPRSRLLSVLAAVLIVGGLAGAFYFARSFARSGYHVAQEPGHLVVFQGREGGFLTFDPVRLADTAVEIEPLTPEQELLLTDVSTLEEANEVIAGIKDLQVEEAAQQTADASAGSDQPSDSSQSTQADDTGAEPSTLEIDEGSTEEDTSTDEN
ncbi:MAG: protein phosphatase 2C domain-containing protein [Actinomycetota bacterium]